MNSLGLCKSLNTCGPPRVGRSGVRTLAGAKFSAPVHTGPGAHPASCKWVTGLFPGGKAGGVWRWPPTPSSAEVREWRDRYVYPPWTFMTCARMSFICYLKRQSKLCSDHSIFHNVSTCPYLIVNPSSFRSGIELYSFIICIAVFIQNV